MKRSLYDWKGDGRYLWKDDFPIKPPPKRVKVVDSPSASGASKKHLDNKKN